MEDGLVVVFSVLDMIPSHDFYFADIRILLPLGEVRRDSWRDDMGHTLRKSTFFSRSFSWCFNWRIVE